MYSFTRSLMSFIVPYIELRPYQFNFMLLGPDRPKFWQMSFNNDSLRKLVSALVWEGLNHLRIRYHSADVLVHRYRRDTVCYSPPNTARCRRTCLSLATNAFFDTSALGTNQGRTQDFSMGGFDFLSHNDHYRLESRSLVVVPKRPR